MESRAEGGLGSTGHALLGAALAALLAAASALSSIPGETSPTSITARSIGAAVALTCFVRRRGSPRGWQALLGPATLAHAASP
jgi:hypothetical protein